MSLPRPLYIAAIRVTARKLVGDCNDYQIIFCARKARVLVSSGLFPAALDSSLEDMNDYDLGAIYEWMNRQK